jgi:hypothetical protein
MEAASADSNGVILTALDFPICLQMTSRSADEGAVPPKLACSAKGCLLKNSIRGCWCFEPAW